MSLWSPAPAGAYPEPHRVVPGLRLPLQQHAEQRGPGGQPAPAPARGPQALLRAPGRGAGPRGGGPGQPLLPGEGQHLLMHFSFVQCGGCAFRCSIYIYIRGVTTH